MPIAAPLSVRERAKSGSGQARHRRMLLRRHDASKTLGQPCSKLSPTTIKRLHKEAETHPYFADLTDTERHDEVNRRITNYMFWSVPFWFGHTPDADAKAHDLKRDHD